MTRTAGRNLIDEAAREAAIASWDAHGLFVPVEDAYHFIRNLWLENDTPVVMPVAHPNEFAHDYRRYCREIQKGNPFITCDLTREVAK